MQTSRRKKDGIYTTKIGVWLIVSSYISNSLSHVSTTTNSVHLYEEHGEFAPTGELTN